MIRSERYADGGCPPRMGADSVLFLAILDNFFCFLEKWLKFVRKQKIKMGASCIIEIQQQTFKKY